MLLPNIFHKSNATPKPTKSASSKRRSLPAPAPVPAAAAAPLDTPLAPYKTKDISYQPRSHSSHGDNKYKSGSELPSTRGHQIQQPRMPVSTPVTPHPTSKYRDGETERHRSRSKEERSRSRNDPAPPLKSCLKQSKAYPDGPGKTPKDGLESRYKAHRRESAPGVLSHNGPGIMPSSARPPPPMDYEDSLEPRIERDHVGPLKVESISLHWILSNKFQKKQRTPPIYFDVATNPRNRHNIRGLVYKQDLARQVLEPVPPVYLDDEASTHCSMPAVVVHCPRGPLGSAPMMVKNDTGVTCADIFEGIYDVYSRVISRDDLKVVGDVYLSKCWNHFERRCEDSPHQTDWEKGIGLRYVDLLRGSRRRIFKGLTQRPGPGISFELHFDEVDYD